MAGRDVGTGALIEPKNMDKEASWSCRTDHAPDTVTHPMVGETENASHTEKLTSPVDAADVAGDRRQSLRTGATSGRGCQPRRAGGHHPTGQGRKVSRITLSDEAESTVFDGLPASASQTL